MTFLVIIVVIWIWYQWETRDLWLDTGKGHKK